MDGPIVFFVDHFFRDHELIGRLPMEKGDQLHFVDSSAEPEVTRIDAFKAAVVAADDRLPCCVVGVGGGATLDTAKAVANLLTNPGKAEDYQGWELVKNPAVYKIGVPTLSGTGSECSRTCVLTNIPKKLKLGMNSDYTVYDQLLLDPDLLATVPRDQYFYTGIDTFMHCVESLNGSYRNAIIDAFSVRAVQLCEEIFLSDDMMSEPNREKMMIASYIGGMAAGNVGVIHPFSAGLGVVLHVAHGLGNCLALNVLGDIYPKEYKQFRTMIERQGVNLPTGICKRASPTNSTTDCIRAASYTKSPSPTPSARTSRRFSPKKTSSNATRASSGDASRTRKGQRPLPPRERGRACGPDRPEQARPSPTRETGTRRPFP